MTKANENIGRLALVEGNREYASNNYAEAEVFFRTAIAEYKLAGNSPVISENLKNAYLNLSATLVAQDKHADAVRVLADAAATGFASVELNKNFAAAHYNLGLQQKGADLDVAIASFAEAKRYDDQDINIIYNLAVSLLEKGDVLSAKTEFTELQTKTLSDEFKLNVHCKLSECQLTARGEDIVPNLEAAIAVFAALPDKALHLEEAKFIHTQLVAEYISRGEHIEAMRVLSGIDRAIVGIDVIAKDLEQYALHQYAIAKPKEAMALLLALSKVQISQDLDFMSVVHEELSSMAAELGHQELVPKIMGDTLDFTDIP